MRLDEKILTREDKYKGILVNIERWKVALPDGREADREIVVHSGAAAIVPVDAEGHVYLVEQWRAPFSRVMLEIPAGKLDSPEEDPLACAQRELEEEIGLRARKWTPLSTLIMSPGYLTEKIGLYLAQELYEGLAHPDDDEFLLPRRMALPNALLLVAKGEICDAKTVAGLHMAARLLGV